MLNEDLFPEEIRPDQVLAALRIGFLFRRVEHESAMIWTESLLQIPDVEETFRELEYDLLALSNRFNDFEARKHSELRNQMATSSTAAFHIRMDLLLETPPLLRDQMRQQIENDSAVQGLKKLQSGRLNDLRKIMLNVIGNDLRISAWFEIGDHMGHAIFRFMRGELSLPLSTFECAQLRSGVRKLPSTLQRRVEPFFPDPNRKGYDIAAELGDTYQGLCNWILKMSPMARPVWDGMTIRYQGKSRSIKVQHNSVIIPILAAFERDGWPLRISHRLDFDDVKQALFKFNKAKVIRLSQSGDQIRWYDPDELPQS